MPLHFHLFGPISIHVYGLFIFLGVVTLLYALRRDKKLNELMTASQLYNLATYGIVGGVVGGKLLYLFEYFTTPEAALNDIAFWMSGFSILGTILGVACIVIAYLYHQKLPFFAIADRIALYTPLAQGIGRLGCFFTGCCYGIPTTSFLGITYTNPDCLAPLHTAVHPTQLYSAGALFYCFFVLYHYQEILKKPGQLLGAFLILVGLERSYIDFLRDDRTLVTDSLSLIQMVGGGLVMIGVSLFFLTSSKTFSFFKQRNS